MSPCLAAFADGDAPDRLARAEVELILLYGLWPKHHRSEGAAKLSIARRV